MRQQKAGAAQSWLENTGSESWSGYENHINSLTQLKEYFYWTIISRTAARAKSAGVKFKRTERFLLWNQVFLLWKKNKETNKKVQLSKEWKMYSEGWYWCFRARDSRHLHERGNQKWTQLHCEVSVLNYSCLNNNRRHCQPEVKTKT